jgi:excisionase family DNA binding protein
MKQMARRRRRRVLGDAGVAIPQTVERPLTPRELANWLKVSPATIRRRLGELPHFRIGNRVRFMPSEVLAHYTKKPSGGSE